MDSCEAAFDTPLVYEKGWGKKLTYVLAFSKDEVLDVTRRYVLNQRLNRARRNLVPEDWLEGILLQKRELLWEMQTPERKKELQQRYEIE